MTCLGLLSPMVAVVLVQIIFRVTIISSDYPYHCTVGFDLPASSVSLCYDVFLSCLFIGIFIKFYFFPNTAQQTAYQSSSLRMMSKRNSIAAIIQLLTSATYYVVLLSLSGRERGLVASSAAAIVCFF